MNKVFEQNIISTYLKFDSISKTLSTKILDNAVLRIVLQQYNLKQNPISLANIRDLVNTSLGANMGDDRIRESLIRQNVRIANAGNNRYVITGSALDEMNQCVQDSTRLHDKIITKYFQGSTLDYEKKLLWFRFVLTEFLMQYFSEFALNGSFSKSKKKYVDSIENIIPFDISDMGDNRMEELCSLIADENAICLRGYASSFDCLAKFVKNHPMPFPSLKIIIAGSEALHDDTRRTVKDTLQCEIISQYANEECGILAQERIPTQDNDNVMYLNHASYFFEILKLDSDSPADYGELGRVVITDLHNYAFPIIRYDTGDVGVLLPPDKFSNGYPILGKLYGRRMDVCYTPLGKPISPMAIGRIMKHFNDVKQWQFVQVDNGTYLLKIIPYQKEEWFSRDSVVESLTSLLGDGAQIQIEMIEEIPVLASGKRKMVINEWKK